jgi:hypothetical protein
MHVVLYSLLVCLSSKINRDSVYNLFGLVYFSDLRSCFHMSDLTLIPYNNLNTHVYLFIDVLHWSEIFVVRVVKNIPPKCFSLADMFNGLPPNFGSHLLV